MKSSPLQTITRFYVYRRPYDERFRKSCFSLFRATWYEPTSQKFSSRIWWCARVDVALERAVHTQLSHAMMATHVPRTVIPQQDATTFLWIAMIMTHLQNRMCLHSRKQQWLQCNWWLWHLTRLHLTINVGKWFILYWCYCSHCGKWKP